MGACRMGWIDFGLTVGGLPTLAASLYLTALAALSRRRDVVPVPPSRRRFTIVVPAHDEEAGIARTVSSLLAVAYPRHLYRVLVVADNCLDRTAERAAAAGADVMVRNDAERRGKGFVLADAFARVLADDFADAIVVVDADSVVSRNLLAAFAARFDAGAAAVQADYAVLNPRSSWRTRVMTIAFAAFHGVRSLSRERLGLSCGLRGNGMGFSRSVLMAAPYRAFSIVEDLEYGLQLGYSGVRVQYVHEARVFGQMVDAEGASRSQRRRWEGGRRALARQHIFRLIGDAWRRSDWVLADLALDLLIPPLSNLAVLNVVGLALCWIAWSSVSIAPLFWASSALGLLLYVMRAWAISGVGSRGLLDLFWAPVYVVWKLILRFKDRDQGREDSRTWIRTAREFRT
jgi:1,2-diacylglycerol 3-beta-glucosyltransferase